MKQIASPKAGISTVLEQIGELLHPLRREALAKLDRPVP